MHIYGVMTVQSTDNFLFKLIAAQSWHREHSLYLPE